MTSQKDQIQGLIAEIDGVLQKTTPRLPWVMSGDVTQQRRVLEKVRNFLVALQRRTPPDSPVAAPDSRPNLLAYDISYQPAPAAITPARPEAITPQRSASAAEVTAQQMLTSVVQEMGYLRSSLMQPLQAELENLRQQRTLITQELRQLELQRQTAGSATASNQTQLVSELLQGLMGRLQETLPQQIAAAVRQSAMPSPASQAGASASGLQADQTLVNFDATLRIVFDALQRDIQAYQESLSQGLDRMHTLGQQSEVMFSALINHLAQQLGREASSYLQASHRPDLGPAMPAAEAAIAASPPDPPPPPVGNRSLTSPPLPPVQRVPPVQLAPLPSDRVAFPYPGVELSPPTQTSDANNAASPVDTAIDAWIRAVGSANPEADAEPLDVAELDLSDLNLSELDLSRVDAQDIDALLELDPPASEPTLPSGSGAISNAAAQTEAESPRSAPPTDLDAALKLLEQLQGDSLSAQPQIRFGDERLTSDEAESGLPVPVNLIPEVGGPRDELDELYESLFGSETSNSLEQPVAAEFQAIQTDATEQLAADPTLGWDLLAESGVEPDLPLFPPSSERVSEPAGEPPAPASDVIHSLLDLFPDRQAVAGESGVSTEITSGVLAAPDRAVTDSHLTLEELGDLYIQASPEEDLLPTDSANDDPAAKLWLDETTLSRLHEDLSYLETIEVEPPRLFEADDAANSTSDEAGWTLDSVFAETPSVPSGPATEVTPASPSSGEINLPPETPLTLNNAVPAAIAARADDFDLGFTLEGMDDLFGDLASDQEGSDAATLPPNEFLNEFAEAESSEPVFTLEGMDDLFGDVSSTDAAASRPTESRSELPPVEIVDLSLEAAFDFFDAAEPISRSTNHPPQPPSATPD